MWQKLYVARSAVLALYVARKLDSSKRFGPRTYPHVEIRGRVLGVGPLATAVAGPRQNPYLILKMKLP